MTLLLSPNSVTVKQEALYFNLSNGFIVYTRDAAMRVGPVPFRISEREGLFCNVRLAIKQFQEDLVK